jgi:hypothetical protein
VGDAIRERAAGTGAQDRVRRDMTRYGCTCTGPGTRIDKIACSRLPQSPYDRIYDA